jgi:nondiscriminating aspartyl-tRNA synthetase
MTKDIARTLAGNTPKEVENQVLVQGWVHARRDHGKLIFIDIRDRSGLLQVVFNPKVSEEAHKIASEFHPEDVVSISGKINKRPERLINPKIISGTVELEATNAEILTKAHTLPFDMGQEILNLELPTLLDYRSLTLRHERIQAIFKVQSAILEGFKKISQKLECIEIVVPTIAASSTEGGAEVFSVDYYGHKAFLTQSPQLYKQIMVTVFERVFTIAHAYRAEPSVTTRHLSETTQMDCEFGFVSFPDLLDLLEEVATEMLKYAEKECSNVLKKYDIEPILFGKIPRLTLREAQEIIFKENGRDVRREKDLAPQDEIDICAWAKRENKSDLITITHFPTKKRAFYTMPDPKNPEFSLSYDLLFRGVEILSGSQRINDYQQLIDTIKDRGMDPKAFEIYLQAFRYGMPPEGGFSFGLERLTMKVLELANIREASLFPRDMERVDERFSVLEEKTKKIQEHK